MAEVRTEDASLFQLQWLGEERPSRGLGRIVQGSEWRAVSVRWPAASSPPRVGQTWLVRGRLTDPWRPRSPPLLSVWSRAAVRLSTPRAEAVALGRARDRVGRVIDRGARSHVTRSVLRALVLGDSSGIPATTRERFVRTGTAHLLAISGLHVGMVAALGALLLQRLLRRLLGAVAPAAARAGRLGWLPAAVGIGVSGLYVMLAGAPVSSRRAWWMLAGAVGAMSLVRKPVGWNLLSLAGLAVGWSEPRSVTSIGAWLSFSAVGGLLAAAPVLQAIARAVPRGLRPPVLVVGTSAVALFATAPLVGFVFGRVAVAGIWVNAFAIPAIGVVLPVALAGAGVGLVTELGGAALVGIADVGLSFVLLVVGWFAAPDRSPVLLWQPSGVVVVAVYLAWLGLLIRGDRS